MFAVRGARYWHHSGKGPYTLLEVGRRTTDLGLVAIYRQEYAIGAFPVGYVWARSLEEFEGVVDTPEGKKPRFMKEQ